jgi:hypothetical protein
MLQIQSTKDYDMFSSFTSNREVDQKHVNGLVLKIRKKNKLPIRPILVDSKLRIIDGQHRLEAARILGTEIYYSVSDNVTQDDIAELNPGQKNWNTMDYINFYSIQGKPEFLKFSKFLSTYPDITISAALSITSGTFTRNSKAIREGDMNVDNIDEGIKVAQALIVLNKKYQHFWIYDSRFPVALAKAMMNECFSLEQFIKKIDINPRAFVRTTTVKESGKMIEEIYNYRNSVNKIEV